MFLVSSVENTFESANQQNTADSNNDNFIDDDNIVVPSDNSSVERDSQMSIRCKDNKVNFSDDEESYGGTIIASLCSKEVTRNLLAQSGTGRSLFDARGPLPAKKIEHVWNPDRRTLGEDATIKSDGLSFTPSMAEHALSRNFHSRPSDRDDTDNMSIFEITDVHPDRVACPFCNHEKNLEWRLCKEQEQSRDLKLSEFRTRFVLCATIVTFLVSIVSFFIGKKISNMESEKMLTQYMNQCNDLMLQREDEELYWKLVTTAFSAVVHGIAGPLANFLLSSGAHPK